VRVADATAKGVTGVSVTVGRGVPPVMARSRGVASVCLLITHAKDGSQEQRESGSRYGWDEDGKPMRVDYEIVDDGEEVVHSWSYIEPWEMP
jgi:hypothetical protein